MRRTGSGWWPRFGDAGRTVPTTCAGKVAVAAGAHQLRRPIHYIMNNNHGLNHSRLNAPLGDSEEVYGEFVLSFRPHPTPAGRYLAYVNISRRFEGGRPRLALTPDV